MRRRRELCLWSVVLAWMLVAGSATAGDEVDSASDSSTGLIDGEGTYFFAGPFGAVDKTYRSGRAQQHVARANPEGGWTWVRAVGPAPGQYYDQSAFDLSLLDAGDHLLVAYEDLPGKTWNIIALDKATGDPIWPGPAAVGTVPDRHIPQDIQLVQRGESGLIAVVTSWDERFRFGSYHSEVLKLRERGPADYKVSEPLDIFESFDLPAIGRGGDGVYVVGAAQLRFYPDDGAEARTRPLFPGVELHLKYLPGWVGKRVHVLTDGRVAGVAHTGAPLLVLVDPPVPGVEPALPTILPAFANPDGPVMIDILETDTGLLLAANSAMQEFPTGDASRSAWLHGIEHKRGFYWRGQDSLVMASPAGDGWSWETLGEDWFAAELRKDRPTLEDGRSDRDQDGLADVEDVCPAQSETPNGFQDDDGCPDWPDWPLPASDEPWTVWETVVQLDAPGAAPVRFGGKTHRGVFLVDGQRGLWICEPVDQPCVRHEMPAHPSRFDTGNGHSMQDADGIAYWLKADAHLIHWRLFGRSPLGSVTLGGGPPRTQGGHKMDALEFGWHVRPRDRQIREMRHNGYAIDSQGLLAKRGAHGRDRLADVPDHSPLRDLDQFGLRVVLFHEDGSLSYMGRAGGFFPVKATVPIDAEHPPWIRAEGDDEFALVTLGRGASFQVIGNAIEPLPPEVNHALPLAVWPDEEAGGHQVLLATDQGAEIWRVQESP